MFIKIKNAIVAVLCFILFYNVLGDYFVFLGVVQQIKNDVNLSIKRSLEEGDLTLIKISCKLPSIEDFEDDEFCYKGNWYDVAKRIRINDTLYLYCYNDLKETALIAAYYKELFDQDEGTAPHNKGTHKFRRGMMKAYFFKCENEYSYEEGYSEINSLYRFNYFPPSYEDLLSPPPKA